MFVKPIKDKRKSSFDPSNIFKLKRVVNHRQFKCCARRGTIIFSIVLRSQSVISKNDNRSMYKKRMVIELPTISMLAAMPPDKRRQKLKSILLPLFKCVYPLQYSEILDLLLDFNGIDEWFSILKRMLSSKLNDSGVIALLQTYHKKKKLA